MASPSGGRTGLNGQVASDRGPVKITFDNSPPSGTPGVLMGFIEGNEAYFTPGVWTAYGHALRDPVGRIHWAGAECSPVWNGYMEGAVRSGESVAAALADELS